MKAAILSIDENAAVENESEVSDLKKREKKKKLLGDGIEYQTKQEMHNTEKLMRGFVVYTRKKRPLS